MLTYILRRLGATILVLLVASFIVYTLTSIGTDPLADLKQSNASNRQELIDNRIEQLSLDVPPVLRYFTWLGGASRVPHPPVRPRHRVQPQRPAGHRGRRHGRGSTIQLVTAATIIAIIFGLTIGILTALRQYSGFDYSVTFMTFIVYSLPIFWIAVLLKEFGAIRFNAFLVRSAVIRLGDAARGSRGGHHLHERPRRRLADAPHHLRVGIRRRRRPARVPRPHRTGSRKPTVGIIGVDPHGRRRRRRRHRHLDGPREPPRAVRVAHRRRDLGGRSTTRCSTCSSTSRTGWMLLIMYVVAIVVGIVRGTASSAATGRRRSRAPRPS